MTTRQHFDQDRAEAFAESLLDALNGGAIALMTSIGHRTGLFDAPAPAPRPRNTALPTCASRSKTRRSYTRRLLTT